MYKVRLQFYHPTITGEILMPQHIESIEIEELHEMFANNRTLWDGVQNYIRVFDYGNIDNKRYLKIFVEYINIDGPKPKSYAAVARKEGISPNGIADKIKTTKNIIERFLPCYKENEEDVKKTLRSLLCDKFDRLHKETYFLEGCSLERVNPSILDNDDFTIPHVEEYIPLESGLEILPSMITDINNNHWLIFEKARSFEGLESPSYKRLWYLFITHLELLEYDISEDTREFVERWPVDEWLPKSRFVQDCDKETQEILRKCRKRLARCNGKVYNPTLWEEITALQGVLSSLTNKSGK